MNPFIFISISVWNRCNSRDCGYVDKMFYFGVLTPYIRVTGASRSLCMRDSWKSYPQVSRDRKPQVIHNFMRLSTGFKCVPNEKVPPIYGGYLFVWNGEIVYLLWSYPQTPLVIHSYTQFIHSETKILRFRQFYILGVDSTPLCSDHTSSVSSTASR
jgi:hypothetical protein